MTEDIPPRGFSDPALLDLRNLYPLPYMHPFMDCLYETASRSLLNGRVLRNRVRLVLRPPPPSSSSSQVTYCTSLRSETHPVTRQTTGTLNSSNFNSIKRIEISPIFISIIYLCLSRTLLTYYPRNLRSRRRYPFNL